MIILLFFAFIAGVVTILSPCILPILPVVLSGSLGEGKKRPLGIVAGFIVSFTFFTLALTSIVKATGLPAESLRYVAVAVIFMLGLSLIVPQTQVLLEKLFTRLSSFLPPSSPHNSGFWGGIVVGLSLGLIWTPCVGPILASVITLAITSQVSLAAVLITFAYALGTGIPMLAITYGGRQLLQKVPWLLSHTTQIQRGFGVVMMLVAAAIYFQLDRQFQTAVLTAFPQYGAGLTSLEDNQAVQKQLDKLQGTTAVQKMMATETKLLPARQKAPDFVGGTNWIGTEPLSLTEDLKGKVVLVDFWTYSCINCIRTFPYVTQWYETYKDQGFVIVGVHAPEFEFEKNTANVEKAMQDFGIKYPVVQDNDFLIWRAYNNRYWPAHYLIDKDGFVRYTHFGEGKYEETENAIRQLLGEEPMPINEEQGNFLTTLIRSPQTPETYLGYERAQSYTSQNKIVINEVRNYSYSLPIPDDAVALSGEWLVGPESITAQSDESELTIDFRAGKAHLVLSPGEVSGGTVKVLMDGQPLLSKYLTSDSNSEGVIEITEPRKYDLVELRGEAGRHVLTLQFSTGIQAFAFTFGE